MLLKSIIAVGAAVVLCSPARAQNQSPMKTTNQKNVNVQKKNDESEMKRIRSKTPKNNDQSNGVQQHDSLHSRQDSTGHNKRRDP